jgi:hypothetical protein
LVDRVELGAQVRGVLNLAGASADQRRGDRMFRAAEKRLIRAAGVPRDGATEPRFELRRRHHVTARQRDGRVACGSEAVLEAFLRGGGAAGSPRAADGTEEIHFMP